MRHQRSEGGFTLTELLVTIGMTSIVTGGMIVALSQTASRASGDSQQTTLIEELTPALALISDESQAAARLYDVSTSTISVSETNPQRLLGFYVPSGTQFLFKMFYLADRPNTTNYAGPKVLYYAECAAAVASLPGTPSCTLMSAGSVVADYLVAQNTSSSAPANLFVATSTPSGQKPTGMVYLNGTTQNMKGTQSASTANQLLKLKTRITARN